MKNGTPSETIIIRRRPKDRIVIRHMIDGKLAGRAEVRKHADDADNFLMGCVYAIDKLSSIQTFGKLPTIKFPSSFPNSDPRSVKVGDMLYFSHGCNYGSPFCGTVKELAIDRWPKYANYPFSGEYRHFLVCEPEAHSPNWQSDTTAVGKIVPCGELKAGDEVLVKSYLPHNSEYDQCIIDARGELHSVKSVDTYGNASILGVECNPEYCFAGKLVRFKEADHA